MDCNDLAVRFFYSNPKKSCCPMNSLGIKIGDGSICGIQPFSVTFTTKHKLPWAIIILADSNNKNAERESCDVPSAEINMN